MEIVWTAASRFDIDPELRTVALHATNGLKT
jgi:hypothetical protein